MTKLFVKKDASELRSVARRIRLTEQEDEKIRHSAQIRQMDVSEFIRRAALGRKADVRYETEIVLKLIDVVKEIRRLHATFTEKGFPPPEAELLAVILVARDTILLISK